MGLFTRTTDQAQQNGWQQQGQHTYSPGQQQQAQRPIIRRKRQLTWYAVLALIAISLLGVGVLALFAWQTWEFVNWLFPNESWLYKGLALVNFDVFSTVWLCLELFLHGRLQNGSIIASFIAGLIDFILSIGCTVIELMRQGLSLTAQATPDQTLVTAGMVTVVIVLLVNLISLYSVFRIQWPYIAGIYSQEEEIYSRAGVANTPQTQIEPVYSRADVEAITGELIAVYLQGAKNSSPLAQAQMQHSGTIPKRASAHRAKEADKTQTP